MFDQAVGWMRHIRVLLPEITVLTRLIVKIRDLSATRIHDLLATAASGAASRKGSSQVVLSEHVLEYLERLGHVFFGVRGGEKP